MDEQATALKAAGPAEWVDELGIGGEVGIDRFFLLLRRALNQLVYHAWSVADWVVHRSLVSC